jgi:hypothetical protein
MPKKMRNQQFDAKSKPQFATPPLSQMNPKTGQQPLVDLQVYEPTKPPRPPRQVDPALFAPIHNTTPFFPPQYQLPGMQQPYYYVPNRMPIVKNYSINVSGPITDHGKVNTIFEDILPRTQFVNTSNTLGERIDIYQFVRSVFVRHHDGEDIDLEGAGDNSLLSYLKFMELNPYNTNHFSKNPYQGLPNDMLIYRSCYPIRWDRYSNSVQCAKNSVGMNIRIYRLTVGEYRIKMEKKIDYHDYDVWRELAYYEYIREHVIKQNICPNFVTMYAYFICENCNIDFNKILEIKGKSREELEQFVSIQDPTRELYDHAKRLVDKKLVPRKYTPLNLNEYVPQKGGKLPPLNAGTPPPIRHYIQKRKEQEYNKQGKPIILVEENRKNYSGKGLVALTESPNYNLHGWASKTYEIEGNIRRMINTGFHKSVVWHSILFQLMVALYVLQINNIAFYDFNIEDNVYIKDISTHGNVTRYWKYIVDGYEYYVPNHGYLLLVDSNFKDIKGKEITISKESYDKKFKIYSNIYAQDGGVRYKKNSLKNSCFKAFEKTFSPNTFSSTFINKGGTQIPEDIKKLLSEINKDVANKKSKDIGFYIKTYMRMLMNNRIGTYLKEDENKNVRKDIPPDFTKGNVVVYEVHHNTHKFVIYDKTVGDGTAQILSKKDTRNKNIEAEVVPISSLFNYSRYDQLIQDFKPAEANLSEDGLLETYTINKN